MVARARAAAARPPGRPLPTPADVAAFTPPECAAALARVLGAPLARALAGLPRAARRAAPSDDALLLAHALSARSGAPLSAYLPPAAERAPDNTCRGRLRDLRAAARARGGALWRALFGGGGAPPARRARAAAGARARAARARAGSARAATAARGARARGEAARVRAAIADGAAARAALRARWGAITKVRARVTYRGFDFVLVNLLGWGASVWRERVLCVHGAPLPAPRRTCAHVRAPRGVAATSCAPAGRGPYRVAGTPIHGMRGGGHVRAFGPDGRQLHTSGQRGAGLTSALRMMGVRRAVRVAGVLRGAAAAELLRGWLPSGDTRPVRAVELGVPVDAFRPLFAGAAAHLVATGVVERAADVGMIDLGPGTGLASVAAAEAGLGAFTGADIAETPYELVLGEAYGADARLVQVDLAAADAPEHVLRLVRQLRARLLARSGGRPVAVIVHASPPCAPIAGCNTTGGRARMDERRRAGFATVERFLDVLVHVRDAPGGADVITVEEVAPLLAYLEAMARA